MTELIVWSGVLIAALGMLTLVPIYVWLHRQLHGIDGPARVLVWSDSLHMVWILTYFGALIVNRFWFRLPLPSWWLVALALTAALHPWVLVGYFSWWRWWR